jgi:multidrug resistance efflux pump
LGVAVLLASAIGAGVILNPSRAGNSSKDGGADSPGDYVVADGWGDLQNGVTSLYPVEPGEVVEVLAVENRKNAKGEPLYYAEGEDLLRLDDTFARAKRDEAAADLKAAEESLRQVQKLTKQYKIQKDQQRLAILAAKDALAGGKHERDYKAFQLEHKNTRKEIVDAADALVRRLETAVKVEEKKLEEMDMLDAQDKIRLAKEAVEAKKAKLAQAQYAVDHCVLRAPVEGMVLRVQVNKGEVLSAQPKQPVILFRPKGAELIVRAEIEQEFAGRVAVGKTAVIEDDTRAGHRWRGKVIRMSDWYTHRRSIILEPLHYNDVRTLECMVAVEPAKQQLRIGQRVRVIIGDNR